METLFAGDVSAFNDEHLRTMFGNDNIVVCSKKAGKKRIPVKLMTHTCVIPDILVTVQMGSV